MFLFFLDDPKALNMYNSFDILTILIKLVKAKFLLFTYFSLYSVTFLSISLDFSFSILFTQSVSIVSFYQILILNTLYLLSKQDGRFSQNSYASRI